MWLDRYTLLLIPRLVIPPTSDHGELAPATSNIVLPPGPVPLFELIVRVWWYVEGISRSSMPLDRMRVDDDECVMVDADPDPPSCDADPPV